MSSYANLAKAEAEPPPIALRLALLAGLLRFASLSQNPIVRLEAKLGLSPAPVERFLGLKSLFSGMTEGVYRCTQMQFADAFRANVFSPFVIPLSAVALLAWRVPKIDTPHREWMFFAWFIALSAVVNIVN